MVDLCERDAAIMLLGGAPEGMFERIARSREAKGRWSDDTWHASHTMHARCVAGRFDDARSGLVPLIAHQHDDGSWGVTAARAEETAYGIVGLLALDQAGIRSASGKTALARATRA